MAFSIIYTEPNILFNTVLSDTSHPSKLFRNIGLTTRTRHKVTHLADWWLFNRKNYLPTDTKAERLPRFRSGIRKPGTAGFVGDWFRKSANLHFSIRRFLKQACGRRFLWVLHNIHEPALLRLACHIVGDLHLPW